MNHHPLEQLLVPVLEASDHRHPRRTRLQTSPALLPSTPVALRKLATPRRPLARTSKNTPTTLTPIKRLAGKGLGTWSTTRPTRGGRARSFAVQRGDSVYDWGSGCGDTLGWMHEWQGVNGFGVELVEAAVVRAKAKFTGPRYCTGNAADMAGIPAERFNHAVAIGTIYQ